MFSFFIGIAGVLISLIGWFCFNSTILLIIGTLLYVIETIMERKNLNAGAKITDIIVFGVGCLVAAIVKFPFYIGGMIAINCYSALISLIMLPSCIYQIRYFKYFGK